MYFLLTDHSPVEELQRCEYVCARDGHADVPTGVHVSSHSTAACFYAFRWTTPQRTHPIQFVSNSSFCGISFNFLVIGVPASFFACKAITVPGDVLFVDLGIT